MENWFQQPQIKRLIGYSILIIIATLSSVTGIYLVRRLEPKPAPPIVTPSQYPDYDAIKGEKPDHNFKALKITDTCGKNGCINLKPATADFGSIDKKYRVFGKFSRAYLYAELAVDNSRPLTAWDDFYFTLSGFGGHLTNETDLLPVPPSDISRYLYDLRSISYYPTIGDKERKENLNSQIDVFSMLQNGVTIDISTAISSDRPGRVMKEVSIYYECFVGSDCGFTELKRK